MQPLRSARFLARLVLAWFALVVAAAAATPMFQPQALEMICSGGGMKLVAPAADDEGGQPPQVANLDCPLCFAVAPPPPVLATFQPQPLGHALQPIPSARIAALTAAPLPARGPPSTFG